ncbi:JmjC domain-containing protein [Pseudozyma hubeiensis]|nr:JmjC domain-containing protein [Pseudozyma hubeiensis]
MTRSTSEAGRSVRDKDKLLRFDTVPSYTEFRRQCLVPNRPCILPPALVADWDVIRSGSWARTSLNTPDGTKVDWEALKKQYGKQTAPVVISRVDSSSKVEEERSDMSISSAIDLIQAFQRGDSPDVKSIYIKDWHLIKQLDAQSSTQKEPYTVPEIFADDWMNNLPSTGSQDTPDDFRFVYAGTSGSQTLLHRDVYTSYSWSTNIVGVKKWYLFPPHVIADLRQFPAVSTSALISDIRTLIETLEQPDRKHFPNLSKALDEMQIVHQLAGETIFVPSNWYHQVDNLGDVVSINRNWCNAHNLPSLYESIVQELDHVEQSLDDVKDMLRANDGQEWKQEFYALVQDVAVKDAGWAWDGFWKMVERNLVSPAAGKGSRPDDGWIRERLLPLAEDFELREDAKWLEGGIRETAQRCKLLLGSIDNSE